MLTLLVFVTALYSPQLVFGATDPNCTMKCECCVDNTCGKTTNFDNECTIGCIDGHRGARCYELCNTYNCKTCNANINTCEACYDDYFLDSRKCVQCPSNCKTCSSSTNCDSCEDGFENRQGSTTCEFSLCPDNCICNKSNCIACKGGFFEIGNSCNNMCPDYCVTCSSLRECNECKDGYYNGNKVVNGNDNLLRDCTHKCRDTCERCSSYDQCQQCLPGKYGLTCQNNCSEGCKDNTCLIGTGACNCDISDGKCKDGCKENFSGDRCCVESQHCVKCQSNTECGECDDGYFGRLCVNSCSVNCKGRCEFSDGKCDDCKKDFLAYFAISNVLIIAISHKAST